MDLFSVRKTPRPKWTTAQKQSWIDQYPTCVYCGCDDRDVLVIDHIYPISLGGSNNIWNLTIACTTCNSHKWNYPIADFYDTLVQKRTDILLDAYNYIYSLKRYRVGRPVHFMHNELMLSRKIINLRRKHNYFTRIIRSIIDEKYFIGLKQLSPVETGLSQ